MEDIIVLILQFIFDCFGDVLLQFFFEIISEVFGHSIKGWFNKPCNPFVAALGYGLLGAAAGGISLWILPHSLIHRESWRIFSVIVTPVISALMMVSVGWLRAREGQSLIRLDRFGYAYIFAFVFGLVRYLWAI